MQTVHRRKSLESGTLVILLVLITLWLLPAPALGQSGWPPLPPTSPPEAAGISRLNPPDHQGTAAGRDTPGAGTGKPVPGKGLPPDTGNIPHNLKIAGGHLLRPPVGSLPAPGRFHRQCPLPPASFFFLQTNLRQYLETWPTPGSTAAEAWPEYLPEDAECPD